MKRTHVIALLLLITACTSPKVDPSTLKHNALLSHEWASFDVSTAIYKGNECLFSDPTVHVIINNTSDSTQDIYILGGEEYAIKITPTEVVHILHDYRQIYTFPASGEMYSTCVSMLLQNNMDYFPMHYPTYDDWRVVLDDKPMRAKTVDGDTLYLVPGKKYERECFSDGYCREYEASVYYWFSLRQDCFVRATKLERKGYKTESTLTDIRFDDRSSLVDSIFNTTDAQYAKYELVPPDTYYYEYTRYTTDTTMTDTVLDWPIVNLASGDTTSLRNMVGSTMLYLFTFYLDSTLYADYQQAASGVDNIVWLMPNSDNAERLHRLVREHNIGRNIYYTKGFTQNISNDYRAFLISKEHQTVACFNRETTDFNEWIEHNINLIK